MIAKQIKGKNFIGAFTYNAKKMHLSDKNKRAEILGSNFSSLEKKLIDKEVRIVRNLRPNLSKYFYHTALSFHPSEKIDNATMLNIAETYLEKMDLIPTSISYSDTMMQTIHISICLLIGSASMER